jgi:hypothetical protein
MLRHYAECRILFIVMLNVNMLKIVMLNVIVLSVVRLSDMAPLKQQSLCYRNFRVLFALAVMDPRLSSNAALAFSLKQTTLRSGLIEAFLESAPQFILQCSIILRTGLTSMILKLFSSKSWGCARCV